MSKIVPISFHAVFQFHYGTIKRLVLGLGLCYHSIFQFHYGTIKRYMVRCAICEWVYFNSTMVRLKGCHPKESSPWNTFQFHYGTIKSTSRSSSQKHAALFQFHYGTIKSKWSLSYVRVTNKFQFHYGTIKSVHGNVSTYQARISIPLWYD